jgi:hypothetical protein
MVIQQEKLQCWFYYEAAKPQVIENKICEGIVYLITALPSGMTSLQVMVASARSVGCGEQ